MTLFTYVRDADTDIPMFGIVADDSGARYVFPTDREPWLDVSRLDQLPGETPADEAGWLQRASEGLGEGLEIDVPYDDVESVDEAESLIRTVLDEQSLPPDEANPTLLRAAEAYDQVAADYGDLDELHEDPQAMANLVLMTLGPIDPEGPNGWILREMDGEPREGDEDGYVHLPGTIIPDDEEASE